MARAWSWLGNGSRGRRSQRYRHPQSDRCAVRLCAVLDLCALFSFDGRDPGGGCPNRLCDRAWHCPQFETALFAMASQVGRNTVAGREHRQPGSRSRSDGLSAPASYWRSRTALHASVRRRVHRTRGLAKLSALCSYPEMDDAVAVLVCRCGLCGRRAMGHSAEVLAHSAHRFDGTIRDGDGGHPRDYHQSLLVFLAGGAGSR